MSNQLTVLGEPVTPLDLRLVPAAVTVWLAAFLGLTVAWWCTPLCCGLAAVLGVTVGRRCRGTRHAAAGWAMAGCAALAAMLLSPPVEHAAHHPLRAQADLLASVQLRVQLTERPRPLYSAGFAGQRGGTRSVLVGAEALGVRVEDGTEVPTDGRVLLLVPAGEWSRLLPGQRVLTDGSLAPPRDTDLTVAVLRGYQPPEVLTPAPAVQRAAESIRAGLREASLSTLGPEPGGLLPGLVDGDTSALLPDVEEEFKVAGLSHLTAVSGTNLAIVSGAVLLLFRACRAGPRTSAVGAGLALVGFVVLAGPEPSVLRAAAMGAVGLLALATGRQRGAVPALAAAVVVLVLHDPGIAVAIGFALSVLATAALIGLAPRWADGLHRRGLPLAIAQAVTVPAAAHLATAPVIAGFAGHVSLVAVAANLVAAPVVAPVTVLGVLAALVSPVSAAGANLLVLLAGPLVRWLVTVADIAAGVPGAVLGWPEGWLGGLMLALLAGGLVLGMRLPRIRVLLLAGLAGVVLVVVPVRVIAPGWPPANWAEVSCDVGQGDAAVLSTTTEGRAVVVDAGPEPDEVDRCLDRLGVSDIPLLVLSHLHADHVGGLRGVLDGRSVGGIAVGLGRAPFWAWDEVRREAAAARVPLVQLSAGQRISLPGLSLEVLAPAAEDVVSFGEEESGTSVNNASVVLRADTAAGRVLLTGDVEISAQEDLLSSRADLSAAVLKIPHHGSRYTLPTFLDAVRSRIAVASVGADNSYGHPSPVTVNRLRSRGTLVSRTDTAGDVAVVPGPNGPAVVHRGVERAP